MDESFKRKTLGTLFPELKDQLMNGISEDTISRINALKDQLRQLEAEHRSRCEQIDKTKSEIYDLLDRHYKPISIKCAKCGHPFKVSLFMLHTIDPITAGMIDGSLCHQCYQSELKQQILKDYIDRIGEKLRGATYQGCKWVYEVNSNHAQIPELGFTRINRDGHVEHIGLNLNITIIDDAWLSIHESDKFCSLDELITVTIPTEES